MRKYYKETNREKRVFFSFVFVLKNNTTYPESPDAGKCCKKKDKKKKKEQFCIRLSCCVLCLCVCRLSDIYD